MDPLDLTQLFVERCERSAPASELKATFQTALEQMGFRYFACCSHVNPRRPPPHAVVLHNYPGFCARTYAEQDLHERDPVFLRAESEILPFHWNAPDFRATLSPSQKRILQEAARIGIADGYTVPLHLPWAAGALRAPCSVVPDSKLISPRAYREVQVMATYLYASVGYGDDLRAATGAALRGGPLLSLRERQCLELAAYGKSDWDISLLLNISEHTVHKHIEAAKRRLGVSTRVQAIVWAAQRREISVGDVVNGPSKRSRRRSGSRASNLATASPTRNSLRSDH